MGDHFKLEESPCYICGTSDSVPWGEEGGFQAVKCSACGLVYVTPRPALREIDESARTGEHRSERGTLSVTGRFHPRRQKEFEGIVRSLLKDRVGGRPVRWLDVGSGHGEMILAVRAVMPAGSHLIGLEPNERKRASAAARGVSHATGLSGAGDEFDVISLMNVYSHLPDPLPFLASLCERLSPSGTLILQTGNGGDLAHRSDYPDSLYLPDHLSFLGEHHLEILASKLGLRLTNVQRSRADTPRDALAQVAKFALRRENKLIVPYRSAFRSLTARFDR